MSLAQKHLLLVASGGYTDSDFAQESWACGIRLWADNSVPDDEGSLPTTGDFVADTDSFTGDGLHITSNWAWQALAGAPIVPVTYLHEQAAGAWQDFVEGIWISSKVTLNELRLYPMQGNGLAFESRVAVCVYDTPPVGGRSGDMLPPQTSVVCSWRTARPGPKGRGRIYPPASSVSGVASDGLVLGTMQGDQADGAAALLSALAVESVGPTEPHARPIVTGDPWTQYAVITSIDVGNVADTQRRRRRQLVETRASRSVTYG